MSRAQFHGGPACDDATPQTGPDDRAISEERLAKTIWSNLRKALNIDTKRTMHDFCRENDIAYKTIANQIRENRPPKLVALLELARLARTSVGALLDELDNVLDDEREIEIIRKYRANSSFANCVDFVFSLTPAAVRNLSRYLASLRDEPRIGRGAARAPSQPPSKEPGNQAGGQDSGQ